MWRWEWKPPNEPPRAVNRNFRRRWKARRRRLVVRRPRLRREWRPANQSKTCAISTLQRNHQGPAIREARAPARIGQQQFHQGLSQYPWILQADQVATDHEAGLLDTQRARHPRLEDGRHTHRATKVDLRQCETAPRARRCKAETATRDHWTRCRGQI